MAKTGCRPWYATAIPRYATFSVTRSARVSGKTQIFKETAVSKNRYQDLRRDRPKNSHFSPIKPSFNPAKLPQRCYKPQKQHFGRKTSPMNNLYLILPWFNLTFKKSLKLTMEILTFCCGSTLAAVLIPKDPQEISQNRTQRERRERTAGAPFLLG